MHRTQGEKLAALLIRKPMTTLELLQTGISVCPWKRLDEWQHLHTDHVVGGHWTTRNGRRIKVYRVWRKPDPAVFLPPAVTS